MNTLVICSVLLLFAWHDILLKFSRVFNRRGWMAFSERETAHVVSLIVSILRVYRGFSVQIDDRLGRGRLPPRFVLVSNHQSMLDILMLIQVFQGQKLRFVAKRELGAGIPFLSMILRTQGHCLIARRVDPAQAFHALDRFSRRCRLSGFDPVIFPEGTRARDGEVKAFHSGGVRRIMAEESIPIVVVAMDGGWRIATLKGIESSLKNSSYKIRIVGLLDAPKDKQEVSAAVAKSEELIRGAIGEMRRGAWRA